MWVGAAISGLGIIVTLFQRDEIKDEIREADSSLTPSEVDTATAFAITITVVVGLIAIGLWLWMAHTNGQGKSWARIVATVLGGLNILFALLGLAQGQMPALSLIVTLVSIALAATILILLYRPDAGRYYEAMTPR
jgi:hypothetical protein